MFYDFITKYTDIFVEKIRAALQKLLTFFQQKHCQISDVNVGNFIETLSKDVVCLEQPGPGI